MYSPLTPAELQAAFDFLSRKIQIPIQAGIVLGSGLNQLADLVESPVVVDYADIPNFPKSTVQGHDGKFVAGFLSGVSVLLMKGRVHFYEGYHPSKVSMGVRLMAMLSVRSLILTNAAGAVNDKYLPGHIMILKDHINLMGMNPLIGPHTPEWGERFVDQSHTYAAQLISYAEKAAAAAGLTCHKGVYAGMSGPTYETPSEIRMLRTLGADVAGMSTVPEAIVAAQSKMRVLGLSLVTNLGAGMTEHLDHSEVVQVAAEKKDKFQKMILEILKQIDGE